MSGPTRECREFEAALRDGEEQAARAHAARCPACRDQLAEWEAISAAAVRLRRTEASPDLWPRIREALVRESQLRIRTEPLGTGWWRWSSALRAAAAAVAVALAVPTAWLLLRPAQPYQQSRRELEQRLLTEHALDQVESAEAAYARSIEALAELVKADIETPRSPLLVSYREKLLVLDGAIAALREQVERNRFNAHLRRELLSVYREKETTLRAILEESRS
jgi:hypothetical protein